MRGKLIAVYRPWNALITCCLELGVVKGCSQCPTELASLPLLLAELLNQSVPAPSDDRSRPRAFLLAVAIFTGIDMARSHIPGKRKVWEMLLASCICCVAPKRRVLAEPRSRAGDGWVGPDWSHSCHKVELGNHEVPRALSRPQKHEPVVQLSPARAHPLPSPHSTFLGFPRERENIWQFRFYLFWSCS